MPKPRRHHRSRSRDRESLLSHELSEISDNSSNTTDISTNSSSSNFYTHHVGDAKKANGNKIDSDGVHERRITPERIDIHEGVTLSWEKVNCFAEEFTQGFLGRSVRIGTKQLLYGISGLARPGQLVAIVGASGAGKTTLLNILTCRNLNNLKADGTIQVNGVAMGSNIKRVSAYVQQSDVFVGCLTVREHLWYNAVLRMGQTYSKEDKLRRVDQLLHELGLLKVASMNTNAKQGGLSGSEKKMLSISSEILMDPPLLFCDEPTTGLDTTMAETVVSMLQMMARTGKTILCTIHQPASHIFNKFDQIILLGEGRLAFQGTREQALDFFSEIGFPSPVNYNAADHFIQTLAIRPGQENDCHAKVVYIARKFQDTPECTSLRRKLVGIREMDGDPQFQEVMRVTKNAQLYRASWWSQLQVLTWKMTLDQVRNPNVMFARIIQNIIAVLTVALLYLQQDYNQKGVSNINGSLFQMIAHTTFIALIGLGTFCDSMPTYFRENQNAMYRPDTFFLAKNISDVPIFVILMLLTVGLSYWPVGYYPDWANFGVYTLVLTLVYQYSLSLNVYFLGVLCDRVDLALNIAPPLRIAFMLLGGYLVNDASFPVFIAWMKYLSWHRYSYEILVINQWNPVSQIVCEPGLDPSTCYQTGNDVIHFLNFTWNSVTFDYVMLLVLGLFFRVIAFIILAMRSRDTEIQQSSS